MCVWCWGGRGGGGGGGRTGRVGFEREMRDKNAPCDWYGCRTLLSFLEECFVVISKRMQTNDNKVKFMWLATTMQMSDAVAAKWGGKENNSSGSRVHLYLEGRKTTRPVRVSIFIWMEGKQLVRLACPSLSYASQWECWLVGWLVECFCLTPCFPVSGQLSDSNRHRLCGLVVRRLLRERDLLLFVGCLTLDVLYHTIPHTLRIFEVKDVHSLWYFV